MTKGGQLWLVTFLAVVLFVIMFIYKQLGGFDFWYWMSSNLLILLTLAFVLDPANQSEIRRDLGKNIGQKILLGLLAAVLLFIVFYLGNILIRLIFERAGEGIQNVYSFKQEAEPWRIEIGRAHV